MPLTDTMPSPRTSPIQSPAVMAPDVAVGVADRLGDLAGGDRLGRLGHLGEVARRRRPRGRTRRARRAPRASSVVGTTIDRLGRQRVDLLGDGDDVLVVGQHDDLVGVDALDRGEQFGRRRVERLPAGDDALHAELPEQLGEPVAAGHGDDRAGDGGQAEAGSVMARALRLIAASRTACSSATSSNRSVTRICFGRPSRASATSIAAPMSLVWTWQFHSPSPPTTTIESPISPQASLKSWMRSSTRSRKYITS